VAIVSDDEVLEAVNEFALTIAMYQNDEWKGRLPQHVQDFPGYLANKCKASLDLGKVFRVAKKEEREKEK
jgi:hypothetical protein